MMHEADGPMATLPPLVRTALRATGDGRARRFAQAVPGATPRRRPEPAQVPVARAAPRLPGDGPRAARVLLAAVLAPPQAWRRSYTAADFGPAFLAGYGWLPLLGAEGPYLSHRVSVTVLVLAGRLTYPLHAHGPEEIYLVLAGRVIWHVPGRPDRMRCAGQVVHHPSYLPHGLTAGPAPVALLSVWRGAYEKSCTGMRREEGSR